jgi:uncharacterized protein YgiM (DUF1202 family)
VRQVKTEAPADVALASFSPVTVQKTVAAPSSTIAGSFVVSQDKVDAVAEVANAAPEVSNDLPIMYVSSRSVNVRGGPSTDFEIVGRLTRAEAVTVVEPETDGWVQIRIEGDGVEGYIAARLLSDTDPAGN